MAQVTNSKFKIKRSVHGYAYRYYLWGIWGSEDQNLFEDARLDMLQSAQLGDREAVTNLTVDVKYKWVPIPFVGVLVKQVDVSAEVIEFTE